MCMTFLLSEPMSRAVANGVCRLEWTNFTECVVTFVVTRTGMRFSGVISTAVLHYVEVTAATRLSIYVPQLCFGLLVMIANGWLLVNLQAENEGRSARRRRQRHDCRHPADVCSSHGVTRSSRRQQHPVQNIIVSLTTAHCLHGAVTVYMMTSVVVTSLWTSSTRYMNQAGECLIANSFLLSAIFATFCHHVTLAFDRLHSARFTASYRTFWTRVRIRILLCSIWFLSLVMGFLPLTGWRTQFPYCIFFYQYRKEYFYLVAIFYFTGLVVVAFVYGYVHIAARGTKTNVTFNVTHTSRQERCCNSRRRARNEANMTTTASILFVVCAICYTPLFLHLLLACPQCPMRSDNDFVLLGMFALALINALIFTSIYAFRLRQFDHIVTAIARRWHMCKVKRRSGGFELKMRGHKGRRHPLRRNNAVGHVITKSGTTAAAAAAAAGALDHVTGERSHHRDVTSAYITGGLAVISGSGGGDILY